MASDDESKQEKLEVLRGKCMAMSDKINSYEENMKMQSYVREEMAKEGCMNAECYDVLQRELDDLKTWELKRLSYALFEVRSLGDLSDYEAEYLYLKDEKRQVEQRIQELEGILSNAKVLTEPEEEDDYSTLL